MAIIYSYPKNTDILVDDTIIGTSTKIVNGKRRNVTKNFEVGAVATFFNNNSSITIAGQNNFFFQDKIAPGRKPGSISFIAGNGAGTSFNSITTLRISKYATSGNVIIDFINTLVNEAIIIAQCDDLNNFGIYKFNAITPVVGEPNFFDITIEAVDANGTILEDKFYSIAVYPGFVNPDMGNGSGIDKTSQLVNDGSNGTSTYVETDELGSTAFSNDYNDLDNLPVIPEAVTKTSDLINDGEDGINPFITLSDVDLSSKLDKDFSILTAATTPLAGTEELAIVQGGETKRVAVSEIGGGSSLQTFQYNTTSLCIFNFPATSNWTRQGGFFGMGAYGSARLDSGVSDFLTLISSSSYGSIIGGIAPYDMELTSNQSWVTQNANLVGGDLKIGVGFIELDYTTGIRSNATVVTETSYTPNANGLVDLRTDFATGIVIPKGTIWLYSWAHTKATAVSSVYIQTMLNFKEVV